MPVVENTAAMLWKQFLDTPSEHAMPILWNIYQHMLVAEEE